MNCPHCQSTATAHLSRKTSLGYPVFRCRTCHCVFNERTATPYNYLAFPTDIVLLHSSPNNYAPDAEARQAVRGTQTRRTSKSAANGATCIVP